MARRQIEAWKDWRPWLLLIGFVVPAAFLLSMSSLMVAGWCQLYFWIIRNLADIDPVILKEIGLTVPQGVTLLLARILILGLWAWSSGFILSSLSRHAVCIMGALFGVVLLLLGTLAAIALRPASLIDAARSILIFVALVILPALLGMIQGAGGNELGILRRCVLCVSLAGPVIFWWPLRGWITRILFLAVGWPLAYMLIARWRRAAVVFLAIAVTGSAQDYPQWRGQNRDGSASAFHEPKVWPEKLTRQWKVEVGEGYATPLVIGAVVYCFTRRGGSEVMLALDSATGKVIWQTAYPAPYKMGDPTKAHGPGPKATPLFHHGKLYTLGINGAVTAFDASTGKIVWQKPAPAEQPFFGTASSPLGDGEVVIFHPGNYGPLTAFDANTGVVKWTAKGDGLYASPMMVELEGVRQIVTMGQENIMGVAIADGSLLWQYPWAGEGGGMQAITPILYDGTILVGSYHAGIAALKPSRRAGKWMVDVAWRTQDVSLFLSNPVLIGDALFGLSEKASGQYFVLDARSGAILWLGKPRQATNTAVVKAGELLFLLNDDGEMTVARSHRTGLEPLQRYQVADSSTWAQPAISGNRIFIKDVSTLTLWTL